MIIQGELFYYNGVALVEMDCSLGYTCSYLAINYI
jgi:hypothetical protein